MIGHKVDARQEDSLQEIQKNLDDIRKDLARIMEGFSKAPGDNISPGDPEPIPADQQTNASEVISNRVLPLSMDWKNFLRK